MMKSAGQQKIPVFLDDMVSLTCEIFRTRLRYSRFDCITLHIEALVVKDTVQKPKRFLCMTQALILPEKIITEEPVMHIV